MPLCFAYGSNMDRSQMAARCVGSRMIGWARLPRHRVVMMREGYLSVIRDPRTEVLGILWDLTLADVPALDRYEGVSARLYVKRHLPVLTETGSRRALVYVGSNAGPGLPKPGYLEGVLAAARAAELPAAYVNALALLGPKSVDLTAKITAPVVVRPRMATPFDRPASPAAPCRWEP